MSLIKETLFYKYVSERKGLSIIEDEEFFILYKIANEKVLIEEMCVDFSKRANGKGKSAISQLSDIAKQNNCKEILGEIHLFDQGANNTLTAALLTGFQVIDAHNGTMLISKKVEV